MSQVGPCLCAESIKLFYFPYLLIFGGRPGCFPTCAQLSQPPTHWHAETCPYHGRGEFATARCASTGDHLVFLLPAALAYLFKGGLVDPIMRALREHVSIMLPPSLLVSLSWKGTHVGLRAAVERVYRWSLQARSLSPRDGG
jgi:hypothetical protein